MGPPNERLSHDRCFAGAAGTYMLHNIYFSSNKARYRCQPRPAAKRKHDRGFGQHSAEILPCGIDIFPGWFFFRWRPLHFANSTHVLVVLGNLRPLGRRPKGHAEAAWHLELGELFCPKIIACNERSSLETEASRNIW